MKKIKLISAITIILSLCSDAHGQTNSRGFPADSMFYYKGEWYFDWVYTVPYKKGNFKCTCDTMGGYSDGLFDKFIFATPDQYTSLQAKQFQKRFINFLMWDEKSNLAKIEWQGSYYDLKSQPQEIIAFLKEIYVTRPLQMDSCSSDFKYLSNTFSTFVKNGMPRGRIPYDAICLSYLAVDSNEEWDFEPHFQIRRFYVMADLLYLQYNFYRKNLDSIGYDVLRPYLKTKQITIGPMYDGEGGLTDSFTEEFEYMTLQDWTAVLPKLEFK